MDSSKRRSRSAQQLRALGAAVVPILIACLFWKVFRVLTFSSSEQLISDRRLIATILWWMAAMASLVVLTGFLVLLVSSLSRRWGRIICQCEKSQTDDHTASQSISQQSVTKATLLRFWFTMLTLWFTLEAAGVALYLWEHKHTPSPVMRSWLQPKREGEFVLWALGGSTMEGVPYNELTSIPAIIEMRLAKLFPTLKVEVKNFAYGGAMLQDMFSKIQKEQTRPNVMLIYSGHNEINHRFDINRTVDQWTGRTFSFAVPSFFAYQMLQELKKTKRPDFHSRKLIDSPICSDTEADSIYFEFQEDLEQLLQFCQHENILAICIIPTSNESGIEPNRSVLPANFPFSKKKQLEDIYSQLSSHDVDINKRISLLESARELAPMFAESWYQLGQLYHSLGRVNETVTCYQAAKDLDGCVIRATSRIVKIYKSVTASFDCILLDGSQLLRPLTSDGVLGDDLFHDELHLNLRSQVALSNAVITELQDRGVPSVKWPDFPCSTTLDEVVNYFHIYDDRWITVYKRVEDQWEYLAGMRFDPRQRLAKSRAYQQACKKIRTSNYRMDQGMPKLRFMDIPSDHLKKR